MSFFVKEDIDGFFGLMTDNLMQLIVIGALCQQVCGISATKVFGTILSGAAISIFIGNVFYAWQARKCFHREKRNNVTALPFVGIIQAYEITGSEIVRVLGVNTPPYFSIGYLLMRGACLLTGLMTKNTEKAR